MKDKTLAELLEEEQERMRRRFVHSARPQYPLTMKEAIELSERMAGRGQSSQVRE